MKLKIKHIIPAALLAITMGGMTSCTGDLNVDNINPQQVSTLDKDALLNKIYSNMILTGQVGPDGNGDLDNIDEGTSSMVRELWYCEELPTDEALWIWSNDDTDDLNYVNWSDAQKHPKGLYYRLMFGVTLCNYFLEQTSTESDATQRAEARFMRALYYSYMIDLYGNPPMVTDMSHPQPPQATRQEAFNFVESELKNVLGEGEDNSEVLPDHPTDYGRASKAAANLLLARLYLNAEVYTGTARWQDAKTYAQRLIDDNYYSLLTTGSSDGKWTAYQKLFMGDNDTNGAQNEFILPAMADGETSQGWGSLFLVAGMTTSATNAAYPTGTSESWGGILARPQFAERFYKSDSQTELAEGTPDQVAKATGDDRALFFTQGGRKPSIEDVSDNSKCYLYIKYNNIHSDGSATHDGGGAHVDIDFPILRLAEAYLTYAEADARLNNGSCTTDGLSKVNALRDRANATRLTSANLDVLFQEWGREFGFEARRRMDMIRFGKFGGQTGYTWQWEGHKAQDPQPFDAHFNLYAIPDADLNANPNLTQNPGF